VRVESRMEQFRAAEVHDMDETETEERCSAKLNCAKRRAKEQKEKLGAEWKAK